jgi:hypothetical protein
LRSTFLSLIAGQFNKFTRHHVSLRFSVCIFTLCPSCSLPFEATVRRCFCNTHMPTRRPIKPRRPRSRQLKLV